MSSADVAKDPFTVLSFLGFNPYMAPPLTRGRLSVTTSHSGSGLS